MPDISPVVAKKLEERARAKTDRLFLAREVLGYDFTEETHRELFEQYPQFDESKTWIEQFTKRDILILWPRGHYKSTAVNVICIQAILINPNIRIILMQGTIKTTKKMLGEIASHFMGTAQNSRLQELFPEYCGVKEEDGKWKFGKKVLGYTAEQFTTPARMRKQLAQATCTVASPKSVKTGQHYDLGIFDDLVNDQNYKNPTVLEKVEEDFNMCLPLIDPGCPRFVSGTRYAFGDLYENIIRRNLKEGVLENEKWIVSLKTCWKEDGGVRFPQQKARDGRLVGFTKEMLQQIMRDTPAIFASQYLNQPALESMQVLTREQMEAAALVPQLAPALSQAVLFVDLAAEGVHPDDSVIISGKMDARGCMYVVDGRGGTWTVPQLAFNLIDMSLRHRPQKIMIEKTASAQYFVEYLKMVCKERGVQLPLDYIKVDNRADAKNIRVQAMAGHVKGGRLKFFLSLPCWEKLVEQTIQFPKGRYGHDDYADTVALMASSFSVSYLSIPNAEIPRSRHPVVAMLDRDPVMYTGVDALDQEKEIRDSDMGSDFAC